MQMLNDFHKQSMMEAGKARSIQEDVIQALTGLRSDLQTKIKEIKSLSGDFKNSVDKEMEHTRKAVRALGDALGQSDIDASQMTGKQDPYLLRLAVDRQLERQVDEENYLHQVSAHCASICQILTHLGIPQPRNLGQRVGSDHCWRDPKGI